MVKAYIVEFNSSNERNKLCWNYQHTGDCYQLSIFAHKPDAETYMKLMKRRMNFGEWRIRKVVII